MGHGNLGSVTGDKAARLAGPVHRASDVAEPSSTTSAAPTELATHVPAGQPGASPVELPVANAGPPHMPPHQPPPYSSPSDRSLDPQACSRPARDPQYYPGLPVLDYRQYLPPMFEISADTTTITTKASYLSENAKALATLLRSLAAVPPKPQILIQGQRGSKVDFSLKLNLMNLLVPSGQKERFDYLRCVGRDEIALRGGSEPGLRPDVGSDNELEEWCERFVADETRIKSFTLERVVANLDTNWIEGQTRGLVAATGYNGQVTVQFPVTHARVVIQNPDRHNKFLKGVTALFTGRSKYEVVKAVWPFATGRNGEPGRRCLVQSEQTWWEEWRDPVKHAIATKRLGWVTNEDKLECIMEGKAKGVSLIDWGPEL
ncbi:hypothetical protein GGS23DRAFT_602983 [Durotheca rogersii]|uniref:uncharacterized protein n=1 Tax=Durotheca rogersii TaxID=419775 RepID=UPI00221E6D5E|nr:uncharacterized protein GGS23DRAFT_602983 [Durotheca rogersii]KAI5866739.1 hypothetical protein GGS23DRAFT_602983 [Durotheca rogersii]